MPSLRKNALDAIGTALNASGKPDGVTVFSNRRTKFEPTELPAINVIWVDEKPQRNPQTNTTVSRKMKVRVECNANDEATIDDLSAWIVKQLFADETLAGAVTGIIESGTEFNDVPADVNYLAATVELEVSYRTLAGDITKKG